MSEPEIKRAYRCSMQIERSRKYQEKKDMLIELWLWLKKIFKRKR